MQDAVHFLFGARHSQQPVQIRRIRVPKAAEKAPAPKESIRVIAILSWFLGITLLVLVGAALLFALFERPLPEFVVPAITGIIGYFGGALSAFFGAKGE